MNPSSAFYWFFNRSFLLPFFYSASSETRNARKRIFTPFHVSCCTLLFALFHLASYTSSFRVGDMLNYDIKLLTNAYSKNYKAKLNGNMHQSAFFLIRLIQRKTFSVDLHNVLFPFPVRNINLCSISIIFISCSQNQLVYERMIFPLLLLLLSPCKRKDFTRKEEQFSLKMKKGFYGAILFLTWHNA